MKFLVDYNDFLFEKLAGNKYYYFNNDKLEDNIYTPNSYGLCFKKKLVIIQDHQGYIAYKRRLASDSAHNPRYNYIYQSKNPLKLFDFDQEKEFKFAFQKNVFNYEDIMFDNNAFENLKYLLKKYLKIEKDHITKEELFAYLPKFIKYEYSNLCDILSILFSENYQFEFYKYYDGFVIKGDIYVWKEVLENRFVLIDGNYNRFIKDNTTQKQIPEIPQYVIDELIKYTNDASKKMNLKIKEWLKENMPKEDKIIYRAFTIQFDDWGDFNKDEKEYLKKLKRYTGLSNWTDIKIKNTIQVQRGKESSWSITPQISRNFTSGLAKSNVNFLVSANVKKEDIIIDFTLLPEEFKKQFKYWSQNEVIVETGKINGIINDITIEEKFEEYLNSIGYTFKKQYGIINA